MIEDRVELRTSTINYAEALVRPAENEDALRAAIDAIETLGVRLVAPTAAIAQDAARYRPHGVPRSRQPDGWLEPELHHGSQHPV